MCLSYPGKIIEIKKGMAKVDYGREIREGRIIAGSYKKGDYVVIQGKILIEKIPKKDAEKWLKMMKNA
jgi:hydrogenase maturation factor